MTVKIHKIHYDPAPDVAERQADYHRIHTKKKGSKRRRHAKHRLLAALANGFNAAVPPSAIRSSKSSATRSPKLSPLKASGYSICWLQPLEPPNILA